MGSFLQYNADKSAAAFVDNSFKRFAKLQPCITRHSVKLVVQSFIDKLMKRCAENV